MIQLSIMTRRDVFVLLLSGWIWRFGLQTDGVFRRFHAVDQKKTWTDAQIYCRHMFTDLATIQDAAEHAEAQQMASTGKFWIGLYNTSWRWSKEEQGVQLNSWFTKWATDEPRPGKCVSISAVGEWSVRDCGGPRFFICSSDGQGGHILVKQLMSWSDAQTHCRLKFTDLSCIRNLEDNDLISSLLQNISDTAPGAPEGGGDDRAWFGLHRHVWVWSDQSDSAYRHWADQEPDERKPCVMMDISSSSADWYSRPCDEKHDFLCHTTIRSSVLRSAKVRLTVGSADVTDPTLQDSILQQLERQLEEKPGVKEQLTLRWKKQLDGNIFHTEEEEEEETAPPAGCDE